ncbi:uncharacterized protein LOC119733898 [Patiria miniata]|uniref:Uncharacterized protein n=1 Tax=Patiria miniata TaxID=46514 RepID=A0A914AGS7_PATMI|nr:uncharacterized protein LOC119733898 [Patiria miniata]
MKCCHFMLDITQLLSKVSFAAQLSSSTVADVMSASIASVIATLSKYQDKKTTPKLKDLGEANTFKGETLTGSGNIENTIMNVTQGLLSSLHGRFSDMTSGLLHALRISSFKFWPASKDEMQNFGNEELRVLVQHFKPTLQTANVILDEVEMEWDMLKSNIRAFRRTPLMVLLNGDLINLKEEFALSTPQLVTGFSITRCKIL